MLSLGPHQTLQISMKKDAHSELKNLTKKLLQAFIIKKVNFLFLKRAFIKQKQKIISVLMHLDMKTRKCIQFIYQEKNIKTIWNMAVTKKKIDHKAISHTMFTLKSRFKVDLNISLKELKNNL